MTPEKLLELITKYGAMGVMFLWLLSVNWKVNKLEEQLYDCYEDQIRSITSQSEKIERIEYFAIIPTKTKIKKA